MVMRAAVAPESFPLDYALVSKNPLDREQCGGSQGGVASNGDITIDEQRAGLRERDTGARQGGPPGNNGTMCTPSSTARPPWRSTSRRWTRATPRP